MPTDRDRAIAAAIQTNRKLKELNQDELAKMVGIGGRSLKRYEKAERAIPEHVLAAIEARIGPCRPGAQAVKTATSIDLSDPRSSLLPSTPNGSDNVISPFAMALGTAFDEAFPDVKAKGLALEKMLAHVRELQANPHQLGTESRGSTRAQRKSS